MRCQYGCYALSSHIHMRQEAAHVARSVGRKHAVSALCRLRCFLPCRLLGIDIVCLQCMAKTDNYHCSGTERVNVKICSGLHNVHRNLSRHQVLFLLAVRLLSYVSSTRRRGRRNCTHFSCDIVYTLNSLKVNETESKD